MTDHQLCRSCREDLDSAVVRGLCSSCYSAHRVAGTLEQFPTLREVQPYVDIRWHEDALCAETDPEIFFPEKGGSTREAKRTCMQCTVRAECLDYALRTEQRFGIFGGMSERERRRLLRDEAAMCA